MPKEIRRENIRVEVTAEAPFRGWKTPDDEARACESLAREIRRHVDDLGSVTVQVDFNGYCTHCGAKWTERSDAYNGGCCDEDEKNNPNPQASE